MNEPMYAMQRANGEWLVTNIAGKRCLPVFQNAAAARRVHRRVGTLIVYRPQPLDSRVIEKLQQQIPDLQFWLVDEFDPRPDLTPGRWLSLEEIRTAGTAGDYAMTA
jgi:hypothetical protein